MIDLQSISEHKKRMAQEDYISFCHQVMHNYDAAPHIINHLVPVLMKAMLTPNYRGIITLPPRHSKSLNVSEKMPAFYLGLFPQNRVISASHTGNLANTFSRRVRNTIQSPRYPFDHVRVADDKGAVQAWDVTYKGEQGGGYYAVGVGGTPTGQGANLIIIDDPIRSAADADSQLVRDNLWEWFTETMYTRLEPGGSILITATRWHDDDLSGRLLKQSRDGGEQWEHTHLPAINDQNEPLWPTRWSLPALQRIRAAVGSRAWAAQYQGTPTLESGSIVKKHWLLPYEVRPHNLRVIQSWDTAYETAKHNDYSVCVTLGYNGYERFIIDVYREKLEYPDLKRMIRSMYLRYRPQAILMENASAGRSIVQDNNDAREMASDRLPIIPVTVPTIRNWKEVRIQELTPVFESGRVRVPTVATWLDEFTDELTRFPLGSHDDQVDAIGQALYYLENDVKMGITEGTWLPDGDDDDDDDEDYYDRRFA